MSEFEKIDKALHKVVKDWEVIEIIGAVIFIPWSLIYIAFRIYQEMED